MFAMVTHLAVCLKINRKSLAIANAIRRAMSKKPSPSRLRMRAERQAKRKLDPIVQAKARIWAEQRKENQ